MSIAFLFGGRQIPRLPWAVLVGLLLASMPAGPAVQSGSLLETCTLAEWQRREFLHVPVPDYFFSQAGNLLLPGQPVAATFIARERIPRRLQPTLESPTSGFALVGEHLDQTGCARADAKGTTWRLVEDELGERLWVSTAYDLMLMVPLGADQYVSGRDSVCAELGTQLRSGISRLGRTVRDPRFGINDAWADSDSADRAGAGSARGVFWWGAFQPQGSTSWNLDYVTDWVDCSVHDEVARGRALAGVVLYTPAWASGSGSPIAAPWYLHLPWDHPQNYWGQFMRRLAQHYADKINTWIIWNEIEITDGFGHVWDGSLEDYVQLLGVAYRAVHAGNPRARVAHYGALSSHDRSETLRRFLDLVAADPQARAHNYFFDIGVLHAYDGVNGLANVVPWYRDELRARGIPPKPIWIGETNLYPSDDHRSGRPGAGLQITMEEQASYIIQALATSIALDVERIGVHRLMDDAEVSAGGEPLGLLRVDGSARPAFRAFQVASRYMAWAEPGGRYTTDESGITIAQLRRAEERVTVAWTMQPEPGVAAIEGIAPVALLVSKYGETQVVRADREGYYWLPLAPATSHSSDPDSLGFIAGGDPVILVERFDGRTPTPHRI